MVYRTGACHSYDGDRRLSGVPDRPRHRNRSRLRSRLGHRSSRRKIREASPPVIPSKRYTRSRLHPRDPDTRSTRIPARLAPLHRSVLFAAPEPRAALLDRSLSGTRMASVRTVVRGVGGRDDGHPALSRYGIAYAHTSYSPAPLFRPCWKHRRSGGARGLPGTARFRRPPSASGSSPGRKSSCGPVGTMAIQYNSRSSASVLDTTRR